MAIGQLPYGGIQILQGAEGAGGLVQEAVEALGMEMESQGGTRGTYNAQN